MFDEIFRVLGCNLILYLSFMHEFVLYLYNSFCVMCNLRKSAVLDLFIVFCYESKLIYFYRKER